MSRIKPLKFQSDHVAALVGRFEATKRIYDALGPRPAPATLTKARHNSACVMFQAPTGIGKTLMACELLSHFSTKERVLWFWFAPFTGVLSQAQTTLKRQAPNLGLLDIDSDRYPEKLTAGSVFVLSWQTVAARSAESRLARQDSDTGWALDALIVEARNQGLRVGVVVDESHHSFLSAQESVNFFLNVLAPDYVLLMSATPRDTDAEKFSKKTGYIIGPPDEWARIPRSEGVEAQLLKRSVKAARFIAHNNDDAQLVKYEELAMAECAAMHRLIKKTLAEQGVQLTPLMLVQVPNGDAQALKDAKRYLVDVLKFEDNAVAIHTAKEPTPDLDTIAIDPTVEVLIFKMAIATGFDAPRAFTLAALRGARDAEFGVQVVGRIMRVERRLQGRLDELPALLSYGYVFLANSDVQEGLVNAAYSINQIPEQLAQAHTATLVTVIAGDTAVQVVRAGDNLSMLPDSDQPPTPGANQNSIGITLSPDYGAIKPRPTTSEQSAFELADSTAPAPATPYAQQETSELARFFALDAPSAKAYLYPKRPDTPDELVSEALPDIPENLEERLVNCIDFQKVLGDRFKRSTRMTLRERDIFAAGDEVVDKEVWAKLSVAAIAEKVRQTAFSFDDMDRKELLTCLKQRFLEVLIAEGHEPPDDPEELTQQLELILIRNPNLIKDAYKRVRAAATQAKTVYLPQSYNSEVPLTAAARNLYGVFPADLNKLEREFAEQLDTSPDVIWWHRNPAQKPHSVALYQWSNGKGFYPDFIIAVRDRKEGDGIALCELKGAHLLDYDRKKSAAKHIKYGRVFMAGKAENSNILKFWRMGDDGMLAEDGKFEVLRMRYSS